MDTAKTPQGTTIDTAKTPRSPLLTQLRVTNFSIHGTDMAFTIDRQDVQS